ncbi:SGNH/GDSL hydrolase family protein [Sulfitobacter guttiformis]|uniref:Lysophospholipase L1-like esterase n=1 Tax=Sulfitobacter guttiformis TaxID=74349 RepID=A0A420DRQ5_9RHOB|nr:SGNH/GDSL hydrolase family protein [Sulfitobacter guttiformis]KIN74338.1 GDSL-like lipase/acylhydrolase [Sulfitobacter guttiformis KCTC 32187]RKE96935.1 lysophospholipase L1-like esterase [Sulfitobacter guttiformis]
MENKSNFSRLALVLSAVFFLNSCAGLAPRGGGDILVIGDSVMAWNRSSGQTIANVMEARLARDVTARAVPGAQFDNGSAIASAVGFDIQAQYPGGQWNWVVMNGGANDMGFGDCGCGDCRPLVNKLISEDGQRGVIPSLIERVQRDGAKVLWMGYYNSPGTSFAGCVDDLANLEARIKRNLARNPDGYFLEGEDFIIKSDPSHFDKDETHPSPKGSAILGTALADIIITVDGRFQGR